MLERNRVDLEPGLYLYQRADVKNPNRFYFSFKLNGVKRQFRSLGEVSLEEAKKLARREFAKAEDDFKLHGAAAVTGRNTIRDARDWFNQNAHTLLSETRYHQIREHWRLHLYRFFGGKTEINRLLQKRMASYVEYRRRVVKGKRLKAAPSTIKLEVTSAEQLLRMARSHANIGEDVGKLSIRIPREKLRTTKSRSTTFTDAEVAQIQAFFDADAEELNAAIGRSSHAARTAKQRLFYLERFRFFTALAFATGARVNELRQVRHKDFKEDFEILLIRKSKTRKGSNRNALIANDIWDVREAYARYLDFAKTQNPNSLVFAETEGNIDEQLESLLPHIGQTFGKFLKQHRMLYEKTHGKRRRNYFATRHYFITRVVSDGVDAFQVAYIAGTSVDQIQKTYFDTSSELTAKTVKEQRSSGKRGGLKVVREGRSQGAI